MATLWIFLLKHYNFELHWSSFHISIKGLFLSRNSISSFMSREFGNSISKSCLLVEIPKFSSLVEDLKMQKRLEFWEFSSLRLLRPRGQAITSYLWISNITNSYHKLCERNRLLIFSCEIKKNSNNSNFLPKSCSIKWKGVCERERLDTIVSSMLHKCGPNVSFVTCICNERIKISAGSI